MDLTGKKTLNITGLFATLSIKVFSAVMLSVTFNFFIVKFGVVMLGVVAFCRVQTTALQMPIIVY
jgi:hypothetical protein